MNTSLIIAIMYLCAFPFVFYQVAQEAWFAGLNTDEKSIRIAYIIILIVSAILWPVIGFIDILRLLHRAIKLVVDKYL